jgi:hypothetical protein
MKAKTANVRMNQIVRALRKAGWRVRTGWPSERPRAQWDFIRAGNSLMPMTAEAQAVNAEVCAFDWPRLPCLPQLSKRDAYRAPATAA